MQVSGQGEKCSHFNLPYLNSATDLLRAHCTFLKGWNGLIKSRQTKFYMHSLARNVLPRIVHDVIRFCIYAI